MDGQALMQIIQTVGFPIFVAIWFMLRLERKLEALAKHDNCCDHCPHEREGGKDPHA